MLTRELGDDIMSSLPMRLITQKRIVHFMVHSPASVKELGSWVKVIKSAAWTNWADAKAIYGHRLDVVKVSSSTSVGVFDIMNNRWRFIVAIHFSARAALRGRVYVLRILTHKEYDKNIWKKEL